MIFRVIDKEGKGEIGYDQFTFLSEEKWRRTDPFAQMKDNITKLHNNRQKSTEERKEENTLSELEGITTEIDRLARLEQMARGKKRNAFRLENIKYENILTNFKINKIDPTGADTSAKRSCGIKTIKQTDMIDVMKHNYLRKSMEQRIHR